MSSYGVTGLACVELEGDRAMFVDVDGQPVADGFLHAAPHAGPINSVMLARGGPGRHRLVDGRGAPLVADRFDDVRIGDGSVAVAKAARGWFVYDASGRSTGPFDAVGWPSESMVAVQQGGRWGFVGADLSLAIEPRHADAGRFAGGLASIRDERGAGFVDTAGRVVAGGWDEVRETFERDGGYRHARVRRGRGWGVVDRSGETVVEPRFARLGALGGGLLAASPLDDG